MQNTGSQWISDDIVVDILDIVDDIPDIVMTRYGLRDRTSCILYPVSGIRYPVSWVSCDPNLSKRSARPRAHKILFPHH